MNEQILEKQYESLGISKEVYAFGKKIEDSLKERFAAIDATVEYNQMKVIRAMQKNKVSAECFNISTGYGYSDLGRDTLEQVYADCFPRRGCAGAPADHLWNPCACACTDVQSAPGR